jgi:hypothetical protein
MSEPNAAPADGLGLADAIGLLRDELLRARAAGAGADIQLPVESMTVELTVTATRSLDGKAAFTVPVVGLQLGRLADPVRAVAVLPDGRVVTGGADRRVLLWDPARASTQVIQLNCSLTTLATASPSPPRSTLAIAHQGGGLSLWSVTG